MIIFVKIILISFFVSVLCWVANAITKDPNLEYIGILSAVLTLTFIFIFMIIYLFTSL